MEKSFSPPISNNEFCRLIKNKVSSHQAFEFSEQIATKYKLLKHFLKNASRQRESKRGREKEREERDRAMVFLKCFIVKQYTNDV